MSAFGYFAKSLSFAMTSLYSPCLPAKWQVRNENCELIYLLRKPNLQKKIIHLTLLTSSPCLRDQKELGLFFLPFFLCFWNLSWVVNSMTKLKVSISIRRIQGKIYPGPYNAELSRKKILNVANKTFLIKHKSTYVTVYLNCWWILQY